MANKKETKHTWIRKSDEDGPDVWYNEKTGERSILDPKGLSAEDRAAGEAADEAKAAAREKRINERDLRGEFDKHLEENRKNGIESPSSGGSLGHAVRMQKERDALLNKENISPASSPIIPEKVAVNPTKTSLPDGWVEKKQPDTNRPYYYNKSQSKTQWEKPSTSKFKQILDAAAAEKANNTATAPTTPGTITKEPESELEPKTKPKRGTWSDITADEFAKIAEENRGFAEREKSQNNLKSTDTTAKEAETPKSTNPFDDFTPTASKETIDKFWAQLDTPQKPEEIKSEKITQAPAQVDPSAALVSKKDFDVKPIVQTPVNKPHPPSTPPPSPRTQSVDIKDRIKSVSNAPIPKPPKTPPPKATPAKSSTTFAYFPNLLKDTVMPYAKKIKKFYNDNIKTKKPEADPAVALAAAQKATDERLLKELGPKPKEPTPKPETLEAQKPAVSPALITKLANIFTSPQAKTPTVTPKTKVLEEDLFNMKATKSPAPAQPSPPKIEAQAMTKGLNANLDSKPLKISPKNPNPNYDEIKQVVIDMRKALETRKESGAKVDIIAHTKEEADNYLKAIKEIGNGAMVAQRIILLDNKNQPTEYINLNKAAPSPLTTRPKP